MAIEVTLALPEGVIDHAQRFGVLTERNVETVLADAIQMTWPTLGEVPNTEDYPAISNLTDTQVLSLADAKMDRIQHQRLRFLQEKGKESGLTPDERYELLALMQINQIGLLRKAEALAEAVRRGIRAPRYK